MAGKHHGWQKRWAVALDAKTATHDSGLIIRLAPSADGWVASPDQASLKAWAGLQSAAMPPPDVAKREQRLTREAREIWLAILEKSNGR